MAGSCVGRSVAKIKQQQKQTRKVLNIKPQTPNVQDLFCLKMHKNCIKIAMNLAVFAI